MNRLITAIFLCGIACITFVSCGKKSGDSSMGPVVPPDTTQPYLVTVLPPDRSINLDPSTQFILTFSEPIDPASVDTSTLRLIYGQSIGNSIPFTVSVHGNVVTIIPDSLRLNSAYFMQFLNAGLRDTANNLLTITPTLEFSTVPLNTSLPGTWAISIGKNTREAMSVTSLVKRQNGNILLGGEYAGIYHDHEGLAEIDSNGTLIWYHDVVLHSHQDVFVRDIAEISSGSILLAGWINGGGQYIGAYDQTGYQTAFRTVGYHPFSLAAGANDNAFVAGSKSPSLHLADLNYLGNAAWEKILFVDSTKPASAYDIIRVGDTLYVCGWGLTSTPSGNQYHLAVLAVDVNGGKIWDQKYQIGEARAITQTLDGHLVVAGTDSRQQATTNRILVTKLDADGNQLWTSDCGPGMGRDVASLPDGGVVVIGEIPAGTVGYLGFTLLKVEAGGTLVWRRDDFPEYWRATQVLAVADGILIAAGALIKANELGEY